MAAYFPLVSEHIILLLYYIEYLFVECMQQDKVVVKELHNGETQCH